MKSINYILLLGLLYSCSSGGQNTKQETIVEEEAKLQDSLTEVKVNTPTALKSSESKKTTALFNGKYNLFIPDGFTLMDEEAKALKYPMGNRPAIVYTNESGSVNLALNHTQNAASQSDLPKFMEVLAGQFKGVPDIKWKRKEITKINGRDFIIMEFETPAVTGERMYNLMFITDLEGRLLMNSFNCKASEYADWESQAQQILNSLKVN